MGKAPAGGVNPSPGPLDATLVDWKPAAPVYRVHDRARHPAEFNPSAVGNARFSPLLPLSSHTPSTRRIVPTLYAGTTLDCALMETVFHDVPYAPGLKTLSKYTHIAGRVVSQLEIATRLTVIDLGAIALRRLGIDRKHLLETEKDQYPASREWAQALYAQFQTAQGLLWTSRQDDRSLACILFGTRIDGQELRAASDPESLLNPDGSARMEVLALARRLNVDIVEWRPHPCHPHTHPLLFSRRQIRAMRTPTPPPPGKKNRMASTTTPLNPNLESILRENRVFPPPPDFAAKAHIQSLQEYEALYKQSVDDPETFWGAVAQELHWFAPWTKVLEWDLPWAKWFVGGKINLCYNCVDRHALGDKANKTAILWEGEPGEVRKLTFAELHVEVQKFANVLKGLGVGKGDRVAIYMGMTPELAIALLACARIGAVHSVIFGGFAANALVDRINDAQCTAVVTQDGSYRRGGEVRLKPIVDEALANCPSVKNVVVYQRTGTPVAIKEGRDRWWHELMADVSDDCPAEQLDSEDPLYILYTSGTTGKPKGLVHTTGGYSVQTYLTGKYVFDLRDDDVYWCTADIGWVTGHSYVVYGILQNGATTLMYEGAPNHPAPDRFWRIVDEHKVSVFYTAPTAIRAFIKWGDEHVEKHTLESLRLLGTVGEPINPEAWIWYQQMIGKGRCPIVDTWWQTETGALMITPIPGAVATKPGSATRPFFGIVPEVVTKEGEPVPAGSGGLLVIRKPWPSMARTIYNDPERYRQAYWSEIPGSYFTGDGARMDADGYFWLMGRVDDVINVSGHRLGTMEIESALVAHKKVAEAAVVGRPHDLKGQAISAFVTLELGHEATPELKEELRAWVAKEIGSLARPDDLRFTEQLPKTRSGKIMRRLLRELATHGEIKGDTTTLEDFSVIAKLRESDEA